MSSSRDSPFSFSPDVRAALGDPARLNAAVRSAFPHLFDGSMDALITRFANDMESGVSVRPGAFVPEETVVGIFSGNIFFDTVQRGHRAAAIPPFDLAGTQLALSIDASAHAARFPSPSQAAFYAHSCHDATLRSVWWLLGPVPCLLAVAAQDLTPVHRLTWNFDGNHPTFTYTFPHAQARAYRRMGTAMTRCPCRAPRDCPRDRFICSAVRPSGPGSDEDED